MNAPSMKQANSDKQNSWTAAPAIWFFQNSRAAVLALALTLLAGLVAFWQLPQTEDPPLTQRAVTITTLLPGASAKHVEATITEKIEARLIQIPEVKRLRSQSRPSVSRVIFEVDDRIADPTPVWSDIANKLQECQAELPAEATKPQIDDIEVSAYAWIGAIACSQDASRDAAEMRELARQLRDRIRAVPGTKSVDLFCEPEDEVVVHIDTAKTASLGISVAEVAASLSAADAKESAGQIRGESSEFVMQIGSQFRSIEAVAESPIRRDEFGILRLRDIATIERKAKDPADTLAVVDGSSAIVVAARLDASQQIAPWTEAVEQVSSAFEAGLIPDYSLQRLLIQDRYVSTRMSTLLGNLALGTAAVCFVTLVLMGWRSAMVVTLALPLVALMVLCGMRALDLPLHQMSVTGLVLALGMLIDNAIIAVDEVGQELSRTRSRVRALGVTIRRLAIPLSGSTLTTAFAFLPLATMPGPTGEFVGTIGSIVILAISSSLVVSLTLLPAIATRLLPVRESTESGPRSSWTHGLQIPFIAKQYRRVVGFLVRHPRVGMTTGLILPIAGFCCATLLSEQFFPPSDRDQFQIEVELSARSSIEETRRTTAEIEKRLREELDTERVSWFLGASAPTFYYNLIPLRDNIPSYAQGIVQSAEQTVSDEKLIQIQRQFDQEFLGARVTIRRFEQGPPLNAPVEVLLYGPDLEQLTQIGQDIHHRLMSLPGVLAVRSDANETRPQAEISIDPLRARAAGLNEDAIGKQLYSQMEGLPAGSLLEGKEEIPVRVTVSGEFKSSLPKIESASLLPSAANTREGAQHSSFKTTPLISLADVEIKPQIASITHRNALRTNEIQVFLGLGVLPADVVAAFEEQVAADPLMLPDGYHFEFGGEAAERNDAIGMLLQYVPYLGLAIAAVLVITLGSYRLAAVITGVGLCSIGLGCGSLFLFGFPFGFTAMVGTVGLVGVAINDAIVVLSALRTDQAALRGDQERIVQIVMEATRHVLCTTFTTMFGFLPLVIGGGGFWPPLAIVIGGGILGATLMAVTFVPAAFAAWAKSQVRALQLGHAGALQTWQDNLGETSSDLATEEQLLQEVNQLSQETQLAFESDSAALCDEMPQTPQHH